MFYLINNRLKFKYNLCQAKCNHSPINGVCSDEMHSMIELITTSYCKSMTLLICIECVYLQ